MTHDQIAPFVNIALESSNLLLGRAALRLEIVLHVDGPGDELGAGNQSCEALSDAGAFGTEGRAEIER
jgi:hypothetical protein